jgi:hypothetical protein
LLLKFSEKLPDFATYLGIPTMAIRVVEFSNGGYKIRKIFLLRINIPKGSY